MSGGVALAASPAPVTWIYLWSVFGLSLTALLTLGWLWRMTWARIERCAPSRGLCWRGKRDALRRVLILGGVFVISAALTFAP